MKNMSLVKESVNLRSLKFLFESNNEADDDIPSGLDELSDKILKDFLSLKQFMLKAGMSNEATLIAAAAKEFRLKVGVEDNKKVISAQIAGQMFIAAFSNLITNLYETLKDSEKNNLPDAFKEEGEDFEKYFENNFLPSLRARKAHLNSWSQLVESLGNNQSVINEGFGDWIKSLFGPSGPKTASQLIVIVKRVLPKANISLQKFTNKFRSTQPPDRNPAKLPTFIDAVKASLPFLKQQVRPATETPPNNEPPQAGADGGGPSPGGGEERGEERGGQSDSTGGRGGGGGTEEESTEPTRETPSRRTGASPKSDKKSIRALLNLSDSDSDSDKARNVLARVKDAKISVTGIDDSLNNEQKQALAAALDKIEGEMKQKIEDSFTESRKRKGDSLIIERWQHLAGIIK